MVVHLFSWRLLLKGLIIESRSADESVLQEIAWSDVVRPVLPATVGPVGLQAQSDYIEESGRPVPTITNSVSLCSHTLPLYNHKLLKLVSVDKLFPLHNHKLSISQC